MELIDGMTPDQLRAMADEMDGADAPLGHVRRVEVDGIRLDVDMRVVSDIRTLRMIRDVQKGGEGAAFVALDLFDRLLGDQRERVEVELSDGDGFCDADAYLTFCTHVFEAVGAKN